MCQSQSNTIGNTMNGIEVFDMNPSFIAIGRLEPLQSFESRPNQAIGLPGNMPVLMCPVGASVADCFATKEGRGNFGFGILYIPQVDVSNRTLALRFIVRSGQ